MVDQNVEGGAGPNHGQDAGDAEVQVPPIAKTRRVRSRRQIYLQIVAAMVILICGVVIGSGAALLRFKDNIVPNRVPPAGDIVRDMRARYDLTEEQAEKAKIAVKESGERMRTIFTGIREKMDAEFKQLSADMKEILTPEQFKQWERDFRSRRGRRPGRFGPGRPGPGGGRPGSGRFGPGRPGQERPGPGGRSGSFGPDPNGRPGPEGWRGGPGGGRSGRRGPGREGFGPRDHGRSDPNSEVE
jgi:hypothetical protein